MTTAFLAFFKVLLAILGKRQSNSPAAWRKMAGESLVVPYGRIYVDAKITGRAALLNALLKPFGKLMGLGVRAEQPKAGKVSGVYYPID